MINRSRLIRLTQKLIRINSENPPGNEFALSRVIAREMRSLGLKVTTPTFSKDRPNVVAVLKGKSKNAAHHAILLTPHIDTVPAGKDWSVDPFGGVVKNGRIYGRGASDDKGNLACAMEVMRSLVEDKTALDFDVIFAATVDEETGSKQGIIPLLQKKVLNPKAALILDSDEFSTIVAQKGLIHGRIQVIGKKAHGAYKHYGVNAIELASRIIDDMTRYRFSYQKHPLLRAPTINIGTIKGGDKVNMVADLCEFSFDLRYLPGMDPQKILKTVNQLAAKHVQCFKLIVDDLQYPYEISADHPLVKTYGDACRKMTCPSELKGSEGATVITFFQKQGIPAIATGYGSRKTAHATDEYAEVKKLHQGARVLERFLKEYGMNRQ